MRYTVQFAGLPPEEVDASFPSEAATRAAERVGAPEDSNCAVLGGAPGDSVLTHWRVGRLGWYARPAVPAAPEGGRA